MIPRQDTTPPTADPARQQFCDFLRAQREAKGLSVEEIAQVTRIPSRSLRRLEAGRFEDLPGDIFVRGFLRSYANCVDLDPEDAIRRYAECGLDPAPVCSEEAATVSAQMRRAAGEDPDAEPSAEDDGDGASDDRESGAKDSGAGAEKVAADTKADAEKAPEAKAEKAAEAKVEKEGARAKRRKRTFLPPELFPESGESRRGPLTLAVIILVIVATLAMSYLMRRPSDAGDGITDADVPGERAGAPALRG